MTDAEKCAVDIVGRLYDQTEHELFPITTETRQELVAAIISKHFPSPVAAEGDVVEKANRYKLFGEYGIRREDQNTWWLTVLDMDWLRIESSVPCGPGGSIDDVIFDFALAALSAQPASVGGVGEGVATPVEIAALEPAPDMGIAGECIHIAHAMATGNTTMQDGVAQLRAALALLSPTAIEPQAGWRTMDSAPRDGISTFTVGGLRADTTYNLKLVAEAVHPATEADNTGDWQLVPIEPTVEMVEAGRAALSQGDAKVQTHARVMWVWEAMLAAAPK